MAAILSIGFIRERLLRRHRHLEDAGFEVISVGSGVHAVEEAARRSFDVGLLGHGIPPDERNSISVAIRELQPEIALIYLYQEHARDTELADAILNTDGRPGDLIETIHYLVKRKSAGGTAKGNGGTAIRRAVQGR